MVEAIIREELLVQEAQRRGLDKDPKNAALPRYQLIALLVDSAMAGADGGSAIPDARDRTLLRRERRPVRGPGSRAGEPDRRR